MKKKSFLIVLGVCIGTTGFVWGTNDKPLYKNPDAPIEKLFFFILLLMFI